MLLFTASGSGAMESAVANLCAPGDRVAVVSHGSFGERWIAICEQHGVDVQAIRYEWGEVPGRRRGRRRRARVGRRPRALPAVRHVDRASSPTCAPSRRRSATRLLVVDAISSLGAVPLETDAWGIDVVVSGSQKALMCPPGLAMASVPGARARAREAVAQLLLRLAREQEGAGQARRGVHAGRVADPQPRRRARADPRRRRSTRHSSATSGSAAPRARASRRWASSSSRPTTTPRPS